MPEPYNLVELKGGPQLEGLQLENQTIPSGDHAGGGGIERRRMATSSGKGPAVKRFCRKLGARRTLR